MVCCADLLGDVSNHLDDSFWSERTSINCQEQLSKCHWQLSDSLTLFAEAILLVFIVPLQFILYFKLQIANSLFYLTLWAQLQS